MLGHLVDGHAGVIAEDLSDGLERRVEGVDDGVDLDAIAGRDVSGNWSYKAYDRLGRVSYEIDAAGYVTGYTRNRWGDAEALGLGL